MVFSEVYPQITKQSTGPRRGRARIDRKSSGGEKPTLQRRLLDVVPDGRAMTKVLMCMARLPPKSLESLMLAVIEQPDWARELLAKRTDETELEVSDNLPSELFARERPLLPGCCAFSRRRVVVRPSLQHPDYLVGRHAALEHFLLQRRLQFCEPSLLHRP